jgi:hypothetical protein
MATSEDSTDMAKIKNTVNNVFWAFVSPGSTTHAVDQIDPTEYLTNARVMLKQLIMFIKNLIRFNLVLLKNNAFHNDIKPANAMFFGGVDFRVIDFGGMSHSTDGEENDYDGDVMGTLTPLFACYYDDDTYDDARNQHRIMFSDLTKEVSDFVDENGFMKNHNPDSLQIQYCIADDLGTQLILLTIFSTALTISIVCKNAIRRLKTFDEYHTRAFSGNDDAERMTEELVEFYMIVMGRLLSFRSVPIGPYAGAKRACVVLFGDILAELGNLGQIETSPAGGGTPKTVPIEFGDKFEDASDTFPSFKMPKDMHRKNIKGGSQSATPSSVVNTPAAGLAHLIEILKATQAIESTGGQSRPVRRSPGLLISACLVAYAVVTAFL